MALKKREKILAIAAAALLVPVVGWYLVSAWRGPLSNLRAQRDDLREEVERKQLQVKRGRKVQDQLADFNRRSLPSSANARSLYQDWLFGLAKDVGFRGITVDVTGGGRSGGGRSRDGLFLKPRFTLKAGATLEVLTRFLHRFESTDYLHQIRTVSIKTTKGSTDLDLNIVVEALSLPDAQPDAGVTVKVAGGTFDTVTRFTPDLKPALVHTGRDGKLVDKAELSFAGLKGAVDFIFKAGQPLDEVRDEINKKTDETGIVARVDNDDLSLSIRSVAADPPDYLDTIAQRNLFAPYTPPTPRPPPGPSAPPAPPKFDPGKYAYVSAILAVNREPTLWLNVRTSGETLKLREGDSFDVGDVHAEIIRISRPDRNAEIEFDGKRWLVYMGDNLRQAKPLFDEAPGPDSEEDAEPSSDETAADAMAEAEEAAPAEETPEPTSEEDTEPAPETAEESMAEDDEAAPAEETAEPTTEYDTGPALEAVEEAVSEDDEPTPAEEMSEPTMEEDAEPAPETAEESMAEGDEAAPAEET